jgi:predicted nucleotide-binding protein
MGFRKDCGPCEGYGYYGSYEKDTCKVCNGSGVLHLEGKRSEYKTCGPCEGYGYYGSYEKDTCKNCHGYGLIRLPGPSGTPGKDAAALSVSRKGSKGKSQTKVFIVHGKNHHVRDQIDLYLTKELGLKTCVMEAGAHSGRTLPEKLEEMASDCTFAIFILTADDVLRDAKKNALLKRARQNVILEVGYFWGALGRRDRVAFLVDKDPAMDLPSDIQGIGWIPITPDLAETKLKLHSELRAAGLV